MFVTHDDIRLIRIIRFAEGACSHFLIIRPYLICCPNHLLLPPTLGLRAYRTVLTTYLVQSKTVTNGTFMAIVQGLYFAKCIIFYV